MNTRTTYQRRPMRQSETIRLPKHGIRTGPPQEQRNLPANTQSPIQRQPQGDNPDVGSRGTASLTAIEDEKNVRAASAFWDVMRTNHGFQNQTASANEVTPKIKSGTPPSHQAEASLENHRNPKRRGSDGEYTESTTTTTLLGDIDTLTDPPTIRSNPKRCIQVGSETYAVTSQPGTSNTGQMALNIQVGRATSALTPVTEIPRTVSGTPSIHRCKGRVFLESPEVPETMWGLDADRTCVRCAEDACGVGGTPRKQLCTRSCSNKHTPHWHPVRVNGLCDG